MGPKKKSKANKLARMSEEEKLRYLQHRAAVEEEARRRKEQLIANFMKSKLKHEEVFTRLNTAKINQYWRHTLRQIKCSELQSTATTLRNNFEVGLRTKNKIIENLLVDLKDSEAQHDMALQFHLEALSKLIEVHSKRVESMHLEYETTRDKLSRSWTDSKEGVMADFREDKLHLETALFLIQEGNSSALEASKAGRRHKEEDALYKVLCERRVLEERGKEELAGLEAELERELKTYHEALKPIQTHYVQLTSADRENKILYQNNLLRINQLQDEIKVKEGEFGKKKEEYRLEIESLKKMIQDKKVEYRRLKDGINKENTVFRKTLTHLALSTDKTVNYLKGLHLKSKQILQVMSNSERYLTERERIMPPALHAYQEPLEGFWMRQSTLVIGVENLKAEMESGIAENRGLIAALRQYLASLAHHKP